MTNRHDQDRRSVSDKPASGQKQHEQAGGSGKQHGSFPHETGGWGQSEEALIRDDGHIESQPGGQRDDLMDRANQRKPRSTGV